MSSEVREFRPADKPQVESLYRDVFGTDALDLWNRRFTWQFYSNPATRHRPSVLWVAEKDSAIVGFVGSFPVRLSINGVERTILCPCDLMVSPEARGERLGERLIRAYIDTTGDMAYALAYSPSAARVYDKLQYQSVFAERVYMRPVRPGTMLSSLLDRRYSADSTVASAIRISARVVRPVFNVAGRVANTFRRVSPGSGVSVETADAIGEEFDTLWNSLSQSISAIFARDAQTLEWRFRRNPIAEYKVWVARDPQRRLLGYAVSTEVSRNGMKFGKIMDLICAPSDAVRVAPALGHKLVSYFDARGVDVVVTKGLHPAIRGQLTKLLYARMPGPEMPARMLWLGAADLRPVVYAGENWHLSHADGDEDFVP